MVPYTARRRLPAGGVMSILTGVATGLRVNVVVPLTVTGIVGGGGGGGGGFGVGAGGLSNFARAWSIVKTAASISASK